MNIDKMKEEMKKIVIQCLNNHEGGEKYFNELDDMIKSNLNLIASYVNYIIDKETNNNFIVSGEIGKKIIECQNLGFINPFVNIICINGGLRKGREIENLPELNDHINKGFIFLDDSYYSGRTLNKIKSAVEERGEKIVKTYVFYDGSKERHDDIESLFRYYDSVEEPTSCKDCHKAEWYDLYEKIVYCCDLMHCIREDDDINE